MERDTSLPVPCGAYDARYIGSVLAYVQSKAHGLDAAGRVALLERASRLPGLGGRFIEHRGGFTFRPDAGRSLRSNAEAPQPTTPPCKARHDR